MATIRDTVKLYVLGDAHFGGRFYSTHDLASTFPDDYINLGTVHAHVEYNESDLIDPRAAQLAAAEQALEKHRAESHVKEQQLIDRIQSLKALTHEDDGGRSEPLD